MYVKTILTTILLLTLFVTAVYTDDASAKNSSTFAQDQTQNSNNDTGNREQSITWYSVGPGILSGVAAGVVVSLITMGIYSLRNLRKVLKRKSFLLEHAKKEVAKNLEYVTNYHKECADKRNNSLHGDILTKKIFHITLPVCEVIIRDAEVMKKLSEKQTKNIANIYSKCKDANSRFSTYALLPTTQHKEDVLNELKEIISSLESFLNKDTKQQAEAATLETEKQS